MELQAKMLPRDTATLPPLFVQLLTALALLASTSSAQQAKDTPPQGVKPLETIRQVRDCLPRRPGLDTRFMYAAWYPMPTKPRTISSYKIPRLAFM